MFIRSKPPTSRTLGVLARCQGETACRALGTGGLLQRRAWDVLPGTAPASSECHSVDVLGSSPSLSRMRCRCASV